ncbi:MAG: UvrD-helicase domain-containing protein [Clostridia bacterium]|nr:UvrD-helicase domain-containing protein [Clostridia bacterium]
MAKRAWTPAQQSAIDTRDRTLLVSAAAGSGKTATLTERIIRTLTDKEHPGDISRMLIVTFTRAAAAELRARISSALQNAMEEGGQSAHLSRQLLLLPSAPISTIDSFCLDLVRDNAVRLGLSPSFRLADTAENVLLLSSVMNTLIADCYEGCDLCTGEEFCSLVDCLTGSRGDARLSEILLSLYSRTQNYARGHFLLSDMAREMADCNTCPPFKTPWGAYILEKTKMLATSWRGVYTGMLSTLAADEYAAPAYLPSFEEDASFLRRLSASLEDENYTQTRNVLLSREKMRLGSIRRENKSADAARCASLRADMHDAMKKLEKSFFAYTEEEWAALLPPLAEKVALIGQLLCAFGERVWAEKRRRGVLSFADLSAGAIRLLLDGDGNPTPLAVELSRRFDAIYVDEYQDVNEVQHKIFEAISRSNNRFMVGDIKQSIYGFRGAQPEIFAAIRSEYPDLDKAGDSPAASLSLIKNFRSLPPVLAFTNLVFGRLMEGVGAHIGYRAEEDALDPGRTDVPPHPRVTVALFEKQKKSGEEEMVDSADFEEEENDEEEDSPAADAEAAYVAREIERLLASGMSVGDRAIRPSDIAILVRRNAAMDKFTAALAARGIASETAATRGFFLNPEILLALSLLNVVDNPRRDIYLAALLRSPLYRFTMDDLIRIRREYDAVAENKGAPLYEALCYYSAAHPDFEGGRVFLDALSRYRRMAQGQPVDRLIWQLYRETGLLAIAGADKNGSPALRRANLMMLYDYARRFEASSYRGLYNFIAYINEAIEHVQSIEEGHAGSERTDTVRILTVHHSKGLEFPVCFVSDCGVRFRDRDAQDALLLDRRLGCALRLRDESGFARVQNPVYRAAAQSIIEASREEEMRVLYVALTRARERLYVTATVSNSEKTMETAALRSNHLDAETAYSCKSYIEMILAAAAGNDSFDLIFPDAETLVPPVAPSSATEESMPILDEAEISRAEDCLRERFDFVYPHEHLCRLPGKMSVSRLYPTALDEGEEEDVPNLAALSISLFNGQQAAGRVSQSEDGGLVFAGEDRTAARSTVIPRFMGGERNTAAMAGTATHLFMQFCDFVALREKGGEAELARLLEHRFISHEDGELVRLSEIERFAASSLLDGILNAKELWRELRFHVRLPAAAFTADPARKAAYEGETVLVQGVMDGVLLTQDGELWLFDYKTDRLSREEMRDRAASERKLRDRYALQLSYYAAACRRIFDRAPDRVMIYSLALGDIVDVPLLPVE